MMEALPGWKNRRPFEVVFEGGIDFIEENWVRFVIFL